MANRIKRKAETTVSTREKMSWVMSVFTLIILGIFPLVVHNRYFDILEAKYQFYCVCTIVAAVIMLIYGLAAGSVTKYMKNFQIKEVLSGFNPVDWAIIAFWLCNVISWLLSDWKWDAFWGTFGRYNGVFMMTVYVLTYFMVTRYFQFHQWYLDAFLAVGIFVCVFGITDYFQMDILGFKQNMLEEQKAIYISTLGNINTYTVYVGALLVISAILFAAEKNQKRMLWYYGNMIAASFALVMGNSDNAYLMLAALFGLSPLYLFKTKTGLRRYLISLASFFTVIQCIDWINAANAGSIVGIDSLFRFIAGSKFLPGVVIGLWLISGITVAKTLKKKTADDTDELNKGFIYAWVAVIICVVAAVIFVIYDANMAGHADRYGAIRSYVVFNDRWGTNRGYVWKRAVEIFETKFTFSQKIFGYGPDTFRVLMNFFYGGKNANGITVAYDSAHNEYLHFLVTVGFAGMCSYIVFMSAAVVKMWRRMNDRPEIAAVAFAVLAYMIQAVVNINLPITMPIILHLLAMGCSRSGKENKE